MALSLVIVDNCLSIDRGVFPVALVWHVFDNYCLRFDGGDVHVVVCDIVGNNFMMFYKTVARVAVFHISDNYYLRFDSGVVHVVIGNIDDSYCLRFER